MGIRKAKDTREHVTQSRGAKIPVILVVAVILLSIILGTKIGSEWEAARAEKKNHKIEITSDALKQQVELIGELALVNYYYTNMGKFEDTLHLLDHNVPFTKKSFVLSYDGEIKAGIDLTRVMVDVNDDMIKITLPKSMIIYHEVDMDSVVLYDEKNSIFNGLSANDVTEFLGDQKKLIEEKAIHNGLLEMSNENATKVIETMVSSFVNANKEEGKEYKINFITEE